MSVDQEHLARVRRLLWALLGSATAASLAGNVTHAVDRHAGAAAVGPIIAAALAPAALLGLTHLLGLWSQIQARGWVYWTFVLAIVTLGAAAFRLSFDALRSLAVSYGYGRFDAALFPLILDGLIAVCTLGLVSLTRVTRPAVHREAEAVTQVVHREADPGTQAVRRDAEVATHVTHRDVADPDYLRLDASSDADSEPSDVRVAQPAPASEAEQPGDSSGEDRHEPLAAGNRDEPALDPAPEPESDHDEHHVLAHRLVDEGRTSADPSTAGIVLRRAAEGTSTRIIADEVGMSPSSVQRLVKAAREAAESQAV